MAHEFNAKNGLSIANTHAVSAITNKESGITYDPNTLMTENAIKYAIEDSVSNINLDDLVDVDTTGVAQGQYLSYSAGTWVAVDDSTDLSNYYTKSEVYNTGQTYTVIEVNNLLDDKTDLTLFETHTGDTNNPHNTTITNLDDTNISSPIDGHVLYYSGSSWINYSLPSGTTDTNFYLTSVSGDGNSSAVTYTVQGYGDVIWDATHEHTYSDITDAPIISGSTSEIAYYTSDNNLGGYSGFTYNDTTKLLTLDGISFSSTYVPTGSEPIGTTYYNSVEDNLNIVLANSILQVGEEMYYNVKNESGSLLKNGRVSAFVGTDGNSGTILVNYWSGSTMGARYAIGLFTHDIENGSIGKVTLFGKVRGISTDGSVLSFGGLETWNDGDELWADPINAGYLTNVLPDAPNHVVSVAAVIGSHHSNGTLLIRPTYSVKLEELSNVNGTTALDKYVLAYKAGNGYWDPTQLDASYISDVYNTGETYSQTEVDNLLDDKTDLTLFNTHTGDTTIHFTKSSINLTDLGDVDTTGVAQDQVLSYSGGTWVATDTASGGIIESYMFYNMSTSVVGTIGHLYNANSKADNSSNDATTTQYTTYNDGLLLPYIATENLSVVKVNITCKSLAVNQATVGTTPTVRLALYQVYGTGRTLISNIDVPVSPTNVGIYSNVSGTIMIQGTLDITPGTIIINDGDMFGLEFVNRNGTNEEIVGFSKMTVSLKTMKN